jgi:hypothetical protein
MAAMPKLVWGATIGMHDHSNQIVVPELKEPDCYSPLFSREDALKLAEDAGIDVVQLNDEPTRKIWAACLSDPDGTRRKAGLSLYSVTGDTPKTAILRCYVWKQLGDLVGIPEELCAKS